MEPSRLFVPVLLLLFFLWKFKIHYRLANRINSWAFSLHKRNLLRTALFFYLLAHLLKKRDYVILNNIGCTWRDLGQPLKAKKYLEKSLEIKPHYCYAQNMLGNISMELGDFAKGIGLLEANIENHPDFGISYFTVAEYYFHLGESDIARNFLQGYFACLSRVGTDGSMDQTLQNKAKALQYYLDNPPAPEPEVSGGEGENP